MKNKQYSKLVQWSEEDQCYVGQCPGVIGPCCHGDDKSSVYAELCGIVDEWLEIMGRDVESLRPFISVTGEHLSENRLGA